MTPKREKLQALASRLGILPFYHDVSGRLHPTSDATAQALATAMGFDAHDEAAAARSLEGLERGAAAGLVDPVQVWRQWDRGEPALHVRIPHGATDYELTLTQEDGRTASHRRRFHAAEAGGEQDLALPFKPVEGYHEVRLTISTPAGLHTGAQSLILAPRTCLAPRELPGGRPRFGLWCNLYSVRSAGNDGAGDFGDLTRILRWAGKAGADFVGVNPLHALRNRGHGVSPYSPLSRLHRNALYLDLEAIPELAGSPEARAHLASPEVLREREAIRAAPRIEYARIADRKRRVLGILFETFRRRHLGRSTTRGRAYATYRTREGQTLLDFATFCALEERFTDGDGNHIPWPQWSPELRDPRSTEVMRFRQENADRVERFAWIQFEVDRQLAHAARAARESGMEIGLYQDLAIGLAPDAADLWAFPELFARAASVGAPPDDYAPQGQDWGLPPLDPIRLRADGYRYFVRLLRAAFAHSGALRIDHVMGLFRLFWIPVGLPTSAGAYVRYPADELLGILALESRRHHALVVGEDLGTVPEEVPIALESWDILSSRVVFFERDAAGAFRSSDSYPQRAMVTANTHDLAPLAAFVDGSDLVLRRKLELLGDDDALAAAMAERRAELAALVQRLRADGLLEEVDGEVGFAEIRDAVHAFVCRTPSALAALSLDDLAGEREPVNVPGLGLDDFPSWSRRMSRSLEAIAADPDVRAALAAAARLRPR